MHSNKKKIGFLIHPRDFDDFYNRYPLAQFIPRSVLEKITYLLPPLTVSKITGLRDRNGDRIEGYVIAIPLVAHTMLEKRSLAREKIASAVQKAKDLNVGILALGGLTASLSKGGLDIHRKNDVGVTTGRAYTVKTVTEYVERVCNDFDLEKSKLKIGIVGAAGSIGAGCTFKLAEKGFENFILIDLERKLKTVEAHAQEIDKKHIQIESHHQLDSLKEAHIVIAATNAPEALIKNRNLRSGTFIINDAQPSDVADEVYEREEIAVIEGGVVHTPNVSCNLNMGLHDPYDNFCCLVEGLLLARNHHFENYSVGHLSLENIDKLEKFSKGTNFRLAEYQNIYGTIEKTKLEKVAQKLYERIK